jgi:hypothetical protein
MCFTVQQFICNIHKASFSTADYALLVVEVVLTLRLTVSQSVCLGIEHPCGTCDQILFPVGMFLSQICGLVYMGRPLR